MIAELESFKLDLAVARYERDGESGSSSHSEGGVSRSYRSEDEILSVSINIDLVLLLGGD